VIWSPTTMHVWVCLFVPFILPEVITGRTKESRYCVSYQFAVLGRVVVREGPGASFWSFE
jgi:hypothetical protein